MNRTMQLQEILFNQGFGTRRICAGLIQKGLVSIMPTKPMPERAAGHATFETVIDSDFEIDPEGLQFKVSGVPGLPDLVWPYAKQAYIVFNKPTGHECSHKASHWPTIYSLLPSPLRLRPQKSAIQGVQAIGRLDQDTTGLLILTDDGALIHRLSSPKHHAPKVYEVTTKHPIDAKQVERLLAGVVLDDSPKPVLAAACEAVGELGVTTHLRLTLTEGKYHQVKRMIAAVGNRVEGLHRSRMGRFELPSDLGAGQWRWLTPLELAQLSAQ
jgi:16S rRNA pseudouridine516 synthase